VSAPRREVIGDAELWLGRCEDVLQTLGRLDAVVVDPPYGIGEAAGKNRTRGKPVGLASKRITFARDYGNAEWDDRPLPAETIAAFRACSRWQIIFGGNFYALPPTSCWLVWDKLNGGSDFADCELAWTNLPKAVRCLRYLWNGCMRMERDEPRVHPTQKPVGVMRWAIGHLPDSATSICDPCMGSGTTGVAAVMLGRKFTGIEADPEHFANACRRIEAAYRQPDMLLACAAPRPEQGTLALGDAA
jgi:hypothetical protein